MGANIYHLESSNSENLGPASSLKWQSALNPQQWEAVSTGRGPCLVIAGAGSGKTRTLIYRVAWLLSQGVRSWNILLLTFTNKAAKEMLSRVEDLLPQQATGLWGGTFHSFANRLLRRHADLLGYTRSFSILDSDDQKALMTKIIKSFPHLLALSKDKTEKEKKKRFPKPELLLSLASLSVNIRTPLEQILKKDYPYLLVFQEEIKELIARYHQEKKGQNSMDFDDLLVKLVELLETHEELRLQYGRQFEYVLVDEYQDTNVLQDKLVDLLVKDHHNLMVVGDDAQSIYSWRGADMKHILSFPQKYPEAKVVKIEQNYRSVPEILELSNESIRQNKNQFEKSLTAVRSSSAKKPLLVATNTPLQQAQFVAQRIKELCAEGQDYGTIAVLYRAHYQALELQLELTRKHIPFQITSGLRFFEQAHVKDLLAFLRFLVNPLDELSFYRMLSLIPGVGPATQGKLWHLWRLACPEGHLPGSFVSEWGGLPVSKKSQPFWTQMLFTLEELLPKPDFIPPSEMIKALYLGILEDSFQSREKFEQYSADIEQLGQFSQSFETLEDFLGQLALLSAPENESSEDSPELKSPQTRVTLSTIHQAKGLEWGSVFLISLTEGMFPSRRALESGLEEALEEERRLFYVAVTRAENELYMVYPRYNPVSYSGEYYLMPSRFLSEFPSTLFENWEIF